jgi:hypothetical protein
MRIVKGLQVLRTAQILSISKKCELTNPLRKNVILLWDFAGCPKESISKRMRIDKFA